MHQSVPLLLSAAPVHPQTGGPGQRLAPGLHLTARPPHWKMTVSETRLSRPQL